MSFKISKSTIHTIRQGDPNFHIHDKIVTAPRAGFEINQNIPYNYKLIISECIERGWLKPVAYITEREMLFAGLSK